MRIIILGAPGTGKGTQAALISEQHSVPLFSTTEVFRTAVAGEDVVSRQAKAIMDSGRGISDELLLTILEGRMLSEQAHNGFILDAFPRNIPQAEALDLMLSHHEMHIDAVMLMDIDPELLIDRIVGRRTCRSCGALFNIYNAPPCLEGQCDHCGGRLGHRADDNEESISNRLRIFDTQTVPLLKYYQDQEKLYRIDSSGSVDEVHQRFSDVIEEIPKHVPKRLISDVKAAIDKVRQERSVHKKGS
jgi:adenylate kinase